MESRALNQEILTQAVFDLCVEAAPERRLELQGLWKQYRPEIVHKSDETGFNISNAWNLIPFTPRSMGLPSEFSRWRVIPERRPLRCQRRRRNRLRPAHGRHRQRDLQRHRGADQ